jgi:hypothetical protein
MNKRKEIPTLKTNVSHLSLNDYFSKETIEKTVELYEYINLPIFKRNHTEISHRFLNWWTKENVLDKNVQEAGRFTFTEFIWIKAVEQLRLFNLPLPFIATLKTKLFEPIKLKGFVSKTEQAKQFISDLAVSEAEKKKLIDILLKEHKEDINTGINLFQLIILESILKRKSLSLAIFPNCEFLILDKTKEHIYTQSDLELLDKTTYIKLSISNLLSEFLKTDLAFATLSKIQLLTYPENKLFEVIHTGEYDNISIQFKDKKIKGLELKKAVDTKQKITDILSKGEFAEITVRKNKGIITKLEEALKITF